MVDSLTLGWVVNEENNPKYWLQENPTLGGQSETDLVRIPADKLATHSIIIAQSGSGKSFFLGRLIEEILLNTKSRCLVLDPNGDFTRANEVNSDIWKSPKYDSKKESGLLSNEKNAEEFIQNWDNITKTIRTTRPKQGISEVQLKFWWPSLSIEIISHDLDALQRSKLYHCHECVKSFAKLAEMEANVTKTPIDLIKISEDLINSFIRKGNILFADILNKTFPEIQKEKTWLVPNGPFIVEVDIPGEDIKKKVHDLIAKSKSSVMYVDREIAEYYFAKAKEYQSEKIIADTPMRYAKQKDLPRLDVINLPSINTAEARLLVISSIVREEWERARLLWMRQMRNPGAPDKRVPTFIIIEEAHNIIPSDAQSAASEALREQFRTIAAEGRKYGIFLIIVSQRPDKLDPKVISECSNIALMRLNSQNVVDEVRETLGLPKKLDFSQVSNFKKGRILLYGNWSPAPLIAYSGARRTVQGGSDLDSAYWATRK